MNPKPSVKLIVSAIPVLVLISLLSLSVSIFKSDSILGSSQVALILSAGVAVALSMWFFKTPWKAFENGLKENMSDVVVALVILLFIGAVSGTWTTSGVVPAFICYGIKIINPKVFLLTACIICAIVSLMTGSSWTTIATIGVALMGIGKAEGFSDGMIAGAIISGAYFGDKISPLSDTTVMASSMCKVPLFTHIRYMLYTTVPSITVTLVIFLILGLSHGVTEASMVSEYSDVLSSTFNLSPWLMVVPLLTAIMIARKMPALAVLALSSLTAAVFGLIFQPDIIEGIGSGVVPGASRARIMLAGTVKAIYDSVSISTGDATVDSLVASRGMLGMMNTIFLIMAAMCFGAAMKASGMLETLGSAIVKFARKRVSMVSSTVATGVFLNAVVSDQYLAIIITSNLFKNVFESKGFEDRLLSRSVEDSATVTSPLIPWSSCGMTQATILSVPTVTYLPFCFFNLISPLMSILVAITGFRIFKRKDAGSGCPAAPSETPPQH
ncbi:MAG: Na+/H+ antiporter NhaC family protein [Candidatus Cryptobacteroides sp.]